jgi:hypothetical protein
MPFAIVIMKRIRLLSTRMPFTCENGMKFLLLGRFYLQFVASGFILPMSHLECKREEETTMKDEPKNVDGMTGEPE